MRTKKPISLWNFKTINLSKVHTSLEGFIPNSLSRTRHNIRSSIRTFNILMRMSFILKITSMSFKVNFSSATFSITNGFNNDDLIRDNGSMDTSLLEFIPDGTSGTGFDISVAVGAFDEHVGLFVVGIWQVARHVDSVPRFALVTNGFSPVDINIDVRTFPVIGGFTFLHVLRLSTVKMKLVSAFSFLIFKVITLPINIRLIINRNITFTFYDVITFSTNFVEASWIFWLGFRLVSIDTSLLEFAPGSSIGTGLDMGFTVGAFDELLGVAFNWEVARTIDSVEDGTSFAD